MEEEKERKEYVMNETGRIWQGTAKNYEGLPWVFGQVSSLEVSLYLYFVVSFNTLKHKIVLISMIISCSSLKMLH